MRHSRPRATFSSPAPVGLDFQRRRKDRRAGTCSRAPRQSCRGTTTGAAASDSRSLAVFAEPSSSSRRRRRRSCRRPRRLHQQSAPPNVILLGVVMDGENARAVVQVGADKRLLRAQMGDDIDGWKVAQIDGRKVVLASQDGRFVTYRLFNDERGGAGANGGAASDGPKNSQMQQAPSPTGALELVQQTKPR